MLLVAVSVTHRCRRSRHFDFDEGGRSLGLGPAVTPPAKGAVANAMLTGKSGGGQPATIKRSQQLSAPPGRSALPAGTRKSIRVLHGPAFTTPGRRVTGGLNLVAYA